MKKTSSFPESDTAYVLTITIIEVIHHADVLYNIVNILSFDEQIRLVLLVSERVYREAQFENIDKPNITIFVKANDEKLDQFLINHQSFIDQSDIIYINTIEKYFRVLSQYSFEKPLIVRIHNVHADLAPWQHLNWSAKTFINTLSYVLRRLIIQRRHLYKKRLLNSACGLMFGNSEITSYVKQNRFLFHHKVLPPALPLCCLDNVKEKKIKPVDAAVVFAITGSIDSQRKNYLEVYTALSEAKNLFKKKVELRLLGKPNGDSGRYIIKKFRSLKSDNLKVTYYNHFIPQDEFEELIRDVDFLIAPIKIHTIYRVFHEIYGKSKMSGIENDIVTHQKPAIVTESYCIPEELKNVTATYRSTEQLSTLLADWVNDSTFLQYSSQFHNLEFLKSNNIRNNFLHMCKNLISNT